MVSTTDPTISGDDRQQLPRVAGRRLSSGVPLLPLFGHAALRERFRNAIDRQALPGSLLLHGARGVGKQQLALWTGRVLLCEQPAIAPCGTCKSCHLAASLQHPDLHWYFPRPRLKGGEPDLEDIREDVADGIGERLENGGLYEAPGGDEAIFVAAVRALVQTAALAPAMGRRKVFVVGDADRMVAQEGSDQAANAFLKLLEEPPANTTILLTTSEPGALLPTIRSRVVSVRVPPLAESDVRAFLSNETVANQLDCGREEIGELVQLAGGAPGRLIGRDAWQASIAHARRVLDAAVSPDRGAQFRVALAQGGAGARGKFSDMLDALTVLLHERTRAAAREGDAGRAAHAARAIEAVERAKERANGNVNPQLLSASLIRQLATLA
jgi:DNA polymerase-3 subunit delta'